MRFERPQQRALPALRTTRLHSAQAFGFLFGALTFIFCFELKTQAQASASKAPVDVFGTNTNLEGSITDKGSSLGLTISPNEGSNANPALSKSQRKGEFAVAPIPMINPSIGNGGGAAAVYVTPLGSDVTSPPSLFGAGGFGTGRASWGIGLGTKLYLSRDRYRITVAGGGGEFNYNFFGIGSAAGAAGISIPLSQRSRAFLIEPKIRLFPFWYLGPRYHFITNKISLNSSTLDPSNLPIPQPNDTNFTTAALGIRLQRDTKDNKFYPRNGSLLDLTLDFFGPAVGGDRTYQTMTISFDKYLSAGKKNVFALHGTVCTASTDAPFFDVCLLGISEDLRGYQIGQFRDNRMLVGQAEFRRELFWRLGAVAFAGAGAVGHTFDDFGSPEPGGGIGLRLVLAKKNHINLRVDYAWGNNSRATYVSLGEAF